MSPAKKKEQKPQEIKSFMMKNNLTKALAGMMLLICAITAFSVYKQLSNPMWVTALLLMVCIVLVAQTKAVEKVSAFIMTQPKNLLTRLNDAVLRVRMINHEFIKNHTIWYAVIIIAVALIAALVIYRVVIYEPAPFYKKYLPW